MRPQVSTSALCAFSSLFLLTTSLPFTPQQSTSLSSLVRRATYSVVPVDGGSAPTGNGGLPAVTILETITEIPAPATKTIVETDTLPPITKTLASTETVVVSVIPPPATVTATAYSIVNVSASTVTIKVPESYPTSTLAQNMSTVSTSVSSLAASTTLPTFSNSTIVPTSQSTLHTSSRVSENPSAATTLSGYGNTTSIVRPHISMTSSVTASSSSTSSAPNSSHSSNISEPTTTLVASASTTTTYDNGQWHTTYPLWNSTLSAYTPSATQAVSTLYSTSSFYG